MHGIDNPLAVELPESESEAKPKYNGQRRNTSYHVVSSNFESWEYETCENEIFKKEEASRSQSYWIKLEVYRWTLMIAIGAATGIFACGTQIAIEYGAKLKFGFLSQSITRCGEDGGFCNLLPLLYWVTINSTLAVVAAVIVVYVEALAGGSGVPQLKCYLNGIRIPRLFRLKTLILKTVAVISSVLAGLAVGKEPAITHCGATLGDGVPQGKIRSLGIDFHFPYFRNSKERRDFVSGGAAIGVAAAFGAPFGGLLFCLEETASFWNQKLTWRMFAGTLVTVFAMNTILSIYHGAPGELSHDGLFHFGVFKLLNYNIVEIPIFIVMGAVGGLLGALYNYVFLHAALFRKRHLPSKYSKLLEAALVGGLTACVAMSMIYFSSDCTPISKDSPENVAQMHCPPGHYPSPMSIWFQTPLQNVKTIFHENDEAHSTVSLFLFATFYLILSCWTMGLSTGSGLYLPCFLIGGAWGRLFARGIAYSFPHVAWLGAGKYAVIGGAAQLGGILRMTICFTAILVEGTGNLTLGLPIMITLNVSKWVGDYFNEGFYDMQIRMLGIPMLPQEAPPQSSSITASSIMASPVVSFSTIETAVEVLTTLQTSHYSGYPVIENERFLGIITRSQLLTLLKYKLFQETRADWEGSLNSALFETKVTLDEIQILGEESGHHFDLRGILDPSPYCVQESVGLPRIFNLFRGLGLRRLVVVGEGNQVVGMIGRIQLAKFRVEKEGLSEVDSSTRK